MKLINALVPLGLLVAVANGDNDGAKQVRRNLPDLPPQSQAQKKCVDSKDVILVDDKIGEVGFSGQLVSIDTNEDGEGDSLVGTMVIEFNDGGLAVVKIDRGKLTIRARKVEIEIDLETYEVMAKVGGVTFAPAASIFSSLTRFQSLRDVAVLYSDGVESESDLLLLSKTMNILAVWIGEGSIFAALPTPDDFFGYAATYNVVSNCPVQSAKALVECAKAIETESLAACLGLIAEKLDSVCQSSLTAFQYM